MGGTVSNTTKAADMRCRLCNRNMFECGGWLERVNAKGETSILECRPECLAELSEDHKLLGAITGREALK